MIGCVAMWHKCMSLKSSQVCIMFSSSDCDITHIRATITLTQVLQRWYAFVFSHKDRFTQVTYLLHLKPLPVWSVCVWLCMIVYVCAAVCGRLRCGLAGWGSGSWLGTSPSVGGGWVGWRGLINSGYTHAHKQTRNYAHTPADLHTTDRRDLHFGSSQARE